jgi:hypothetical protein
VVLPLLTAALAVLSLSPTSARAADTLLSRGKPATAFSVEAAAYGAANTVDGSTATRWSSAFSDPQWIYVDLGATATINRVVLNWEAAYGKAYQIQVSDDGTSWTTISTVTNGAGGVNDLTVSGSGRYVRMYGTARGTRYGYSLWEFQVYGTQVSTDATLLSQGKTATASSVEAAYVAANAVDGKAATRWGSAFSDPQWISVDLGATATISRVVLNWEAAYGKAYQIQVSDDATSWTTISTVTSGTGGVNDLAVSGSGRYVRMYGTARGTRYGYSLWEFQVYGTAGGSGPTPTTCSTLPSVPTGLAASSVSSTSVALSWNASPPGANCTITGYRVYQNGVQAAAPTETAASLSGLAPGTTYSFTVAAVNAFGASAQSTALSVTTGASGDGEPTGFWDASVIPQAKNVMMFKFLNRTNGKFKDSQLYWAFTQNGVTQVHSFAEAPLFDMPANSSGRMYFYVVVDPTDTVLAQNPTKSPYYDFIEFTIGGSPPRFNGNTTRVDAFGLKIAMRLHSPDGDDTVGEDYATFQEDRQATFDRFIAETPAEFAHLAQAPFAPYRIVEPGTGQFKAGGTYQHYMDGWVDQLWASNGLTVAKPTANCNPIEQPDLSAACHRHVGLGAFNANGTLKSGNTLWSSSAGFYPASPANYYARFWHAHSLGGKAYGFPYDDVGGYSSYISHASPDYMLVAVGW